MVQNQFLQKFYKGLVYIGILTLFGCVDEFGLNDIPEEKIFLYAELSAGESVEIRLAKTTLFGMNREYDLINDAVVIFGTDNGDNRILFDSNRNSFYEDLLKIEENKLYTLDASLPQSSLRSIHAETYVPYNRPYQNLTVRSISNDLDPLHLEFNFVFDTQNISDYYHIVPYYYLNEIVDQDTIQSLEKLYIEFDNLTETSSVASNLAHRGGILLNSAELVSGSLTVSGSLSQYMSDTQFVKEVFVELRSTDVSYYTYHSRLSKQILSAQSDLEQPVLTISNVESGLGLLGSYSKETNVVSVQ